MVYNTKYTKSRYYNTVIKQECLHGDETIIFNKKNEDIQKKKDRFLEKYYVQNAQTN